MTALSHEQQSELNALWESRDYRAWFARLQEIAPEEVEKLPDYMRDAFLKLNEKKKEVSGIYVPPECAPERLAHYAVAPADELVVDLPYPDETSGEMRSEQATAGMLRQLVEQAERDPKIVRLVLDYFEAVEIDTALNQQTASDELWRTVLRAYDPVLVRLFGRDVGRGRAGTNLRNISMYMIRNHILPFGEA